MICVTNSGQEINLNNKEVKAAKKLVNEFLESVEKSSAINKRPTFYITVLLMMEMMAGDALNNISSQRLNELVNSFSSQTKINGKE